MTTNANAKLSSRALLEALVADFHGRGGKVIKVATGKRPRSIGRGGRKGR